jgi:antitoxin ParD1/3/4
MAGTAKRTFSLSAEQAAYIDAKVQAGGYASGSEVVRAGLRALQERDAAVERWLREEVVPVCEAIDGGRMETYPIDDVFRELKSRSRSGRVRSEKAKS